MRIGSFIFTVIGLLGAVFSFLELSGASLPYQEMQRQKCWSSNPLAFPCRLQNRAPLQIEAILTGSYVEKLAS